MKEEEGEENKEREKKKRKGIWTEEEGWRR